MIKSIAIIGTGAIGSYCAIKLALANFNVHCLMRSDFAHVKQHGLTLLSGNEKFNVPVNAYQAIHDMPVCDVIIVALKTTENSILKKMLPLISHKNTIVIMLQNGIGAEQELAEFINPDNLIGGSFMFKVSKEAAGMIRHFGLNAIELAQYYSDMHQEGVTENVIALVECCVKANIPCTASPHLMTMRWKKLAGNIAINGLSVVLDAYTQDLVNHPASYSLLCAITKEVIATADKCGAKLPNDFYQYRMRVLDKHKEIEKNYSSMKEDFNAKRPLELLGIYKNAIDLAARNGLTMPLTEMLYQQLQYLNEKNLAR